MDYHKNAALFHSVSAYLAPRSHMSAEVSIVKHEGRNGMISELALHVVMQGIEVSGVLASQATRATQGDFERYASE